jgi:hypothetical protein
MFRKTCRCGKTQKNFKHDIGEFFIADCCLEAGYNHKGEKVGEETLDAVEIVEEVQEAIEPLPKEVQEEVIDDIVESVANDINELSLKELKKLADEKGVKYGKNITKKGLIKKLAKA